MVGLSSGLTSIGTANFASPFTSNSQSPKGSASTFGANFSDLLVSTSSGQGSGATASAQSVAAAASAAAIDVDGLQKFSKAFGSNPNHYRIGMQTIGSDGRVIAGARWTVTEIFQSTAVAARAIPPAASTCLSATNDGDW